MLLTYPLMVGIQIVSARIGRVTGHGLAANIREHLSAAGCCTLIVGLLLVANTINIAADLGAMGEALRAAGRRPGAIYIVLFGVVCVALQIFIPVSRATSRSSSG